MLSRLLRTEGLVVRVARISLAVGAIAACHEDGESSGPAGAAASSSSGDGGATASSGEGGNGSTVTGTGGAAPSCDGALAGAPCDVEGAACEELIGQGLCAEGLPRVTSCTGGRWEIFTAISCGAFVADPSCTIPGVYLVEPSGPFLPEDGGSLVDEHGAPFEVTFEVRDDGRLYVSAELGWVEPGSCAVRAGWTLAESCEELDGQSFCTTIDRRLELTMSTEPATGTVELECWGECGITVTAPVTATRL